MDYAIYKTVDGMNPRVIHRFTQDACKRHAKRAAVDKLDNMWLHVLRRGFCNAEGKREEFSYDYPVDTTRSERIRFYIAKL